MTSSKNVRVGKIDLDTIGAAWLFGVNAEDDIQVIRGDASPTDLADSEVICIEVGGSGQVEMNNFDHHGEGSENLSSAVLQVFRKWEACAECSYQDGAVWSGFGEHNALEGGCWNPLEVDCEEKTISRIVDYINILDLKGTEEIRRRSSGENPFLSDIVSGILLVKRNPVEQLLEGIRFLQLLADSEIDPFGSMQELVKKYPELEGYAEAKAENNRQIAKALKDAKWGETRTGLKMAWLETSFFGALGALYNNGAQVAVALNPDFNGVRKFTVGGNGQKVNSILSLLNEVESGWGGPGTGTIIGSPKSGSSMDLDEVVKIVKGL